MIRIACAHPCRPCSPAPTPLSGQVAQVEEALGARLFERSHVGVLAAPDRVLDDKTEALVQRLADGQIEGAIVALEADVGDVEKLVIGTRSSS
jgi:DNA-binding transcriptional LysR family regulator